MTFTTLILVVIILLFGRAGFLPSCAHILSGLKEDSLLGVGTLTSPQASPGGVLHAKFACTRGSNFSQFQIDPRQKNSQILQNNFAIITLACFFSGG